jgi:membrane fusion protein, multidrug efflux system
MVLSFPRASAFATLVVVLAAVVGCRGNKEAPPPPPPPHVTIARPVTKMVQSYVEYNGNLDAVDTVQVKARVKGFLNKIEFTEGEEVKEGDLMYQIDPREYQAGVAKSNADIAKAKADIATANALIKRDETGLERVNQLFAKGNAAKAEVDTAVAQLAASQAQLDTAKANVDAGKAALQTAELDLEYTTIKAPIAGLTSRTLVTRGNLVGQNEVTLLTTIVRMDPLFVNFDVPERDLMEYQGNLHTKKLSTAQAILAIEVGVATEEGYPHIGRLDFGENHVEPGTGTIRLRGRIPNPRVHDNERVLYPGLYARVRIPRGTPQPRQVIPEDALMTGQEGRFIYIVNADNIVEKRTVTVGPQVWAPPPPNSPPEPGWTLVNPAAPTKPTSVNSVVAIMTGLNPGDRVIVNGLQRARPGSPVVPDEWELHGLPEPKPAEKK